jgi:hypothetical protein
MREDLIRPDGADDGKVRAEKGGRHRAFGRVTGGTTFVNQKGYKMP